MLWWEEMVMGLPASNPSPPMALGLWKNFLLCGCIMKMRKTLNHNHLMAEVGYHRIHRWFGTSIR